MLALLPAMAHAKLDSLAIHGDSVFLRDRSAVDGMICAGKIGVDPSVVKPALCLEKRTEPVLPVIASAVRAVEVEAWDTLAVLDTGEHGDVLVRSGAKLRLRAGVHRLRSLTLEWDARLELDSVEAGDTGAVQVLVAGAVHLMDRVGSSVGSVFDTTALAGVAGRLTVVAASLKLDNDLRVGGQWVALGRLSVGDRCVVAGSLSGATVVLGYDSRLVFVAGGIAETELPVVRILSPVTGLTTNAVSLPVSWSVEGVVRSDVEALGAEGLQTIRRCAGSVCAGVDVIVDRTAPVVKILSPADGAWTNKATLPLIWSVDGVSQTETITLAEGTGTVSRYASDAAGNRGKASIVLTVKTIPPVVVITSPADGAVVTDSVISLVWSVDGAIRTETVKLILGANEISRSFTDSAGNVGTAKVTVTRKAVVVPQPEPVIPGRIAAPPIPRVPSPSFSSQVDFLWKGENAVQKGVRDGSIHERLLAVVRGTVLTEDGAPLAGAKVTVLGHPEWGYTYSREDGWYDLALDGGSSTVIDVQKDGYCPSQRRLVPESGDYAHVVEIRLVKLDPKVTVVNTDGTSTELQVASGTPQTDEDGTRTAVVAVQPGTKATLRMPDGSVREVSSLSIRATEYTVGKDGLARMPADIPANVAYTYAVELSADEAIAAGAEQIQFDKPVAVTVDNFIGFPVGINAPLGWYSRAKGAWIAADNGRVIKLLGNDGGKAILDVQGKGVAASQDALKALGITELELVDLANRYEVGKSFWRVQVDHFTPWDINWGISPPEDAEPPEVKVESKEQDEECAEECGSIVGVQDRRLGEVIQIPGSGQALIFSSARTKGNAVRRTIKIQVSGATVPASLKAIELDIDVAGRRHSLSFPPKPNQVHTFVWDGKDGYGREVPQGRVLSTVRNVFKGVYQQTARFGYAGEGVRIEGNRAAGLFRFPEAVKSSVSQTTGDAWLLSGWDALNPASRRIAKSSGGVGRYSALSEAEVTSPLQNIPGWPPAMRIGKDGSFWIGAYSNSQVLQYSSNRMLKMPPISSSSIPVSENFILRTLVA